MRLGTEIMTLGFLACVVFLCSIAGFFNFLADTTESTHGDAAPMSDNGGSSTGGTSGVAAHCDDHCRLSPTDGGGLLTGPLSMAMPRTSGDFLHLTEEVHTRMSIYMVIYFSISRASSRPPWQGFSSGLS